MTPLPELRALTAAINQDAAAAKSGNEGFGQPGAHQAFTLALLTAWPTIAAAVDDLAAQVEDAQTELAEVQKALTEWRLACEAAEAERDALAARLDAAETEAEQWKRVARRIADDAFTSGGSALQYYADAEEAAHPEEMTS